MNALTMSIATIAGAAMLPFSSHNFINQASATHDAQKQSVTISRPKVEKASQVTKVEAPAPVMVTVQPGDYLEKIATANNTSSERLFYANAEVASPDLVFPGQQLRVPTADENLTPRDIPAPKPAPAPAAPATSAAPSTSAPRPAASAAPAVSGGSVWDSLAACESGGNWAINTSNGFYGGLQFTLGSWQAVGGSGLPSQASREEQIMRGQMLQSRGGWGNWPACAAKLGLR